MEGNFTLERVSTTKWKVIPPWKRFIPPNGRGFHPGKV
jgi:hypothetical protein